MATPIAFDILGRDRGASTALDKVANKAEHTGRKFGFLAARSHGLTAGMSLGLGKVAAAMGAVATISVFKGFIDEARESRKVSALTESIIKSTGGAAKISAKQVGALATSISNKTGVDDEAIQSGSNLLLTFKNVRNEVGKGAQIFDRATAAAVDLSAAGFGDVNNASKMLGKALNDPLKGISALGKAGVTFTADQKKQIATLVETGKTLEAQKIILGEVESQVGGAAAAAADPMAKLGVIIGNVKETIGAAFLPIVDKAATWLGDKLPGAVDKAGKFFSEKLLPPLKTIAGFVKDRVIPMVSDIVDKFSGLGSKIVDAIGTIDLGGIADDIWTGASKWAGSLIGGLKSGIDKGDWKPLGAAVGDGVVAALRGASTFGEKMGKAFKELMDKVDWEKIGHDSTAAISRFISGVDWAQVAKALGVMAFKSLKINKTVYDSVVNSAADLVVGIARALVEELGHWYSWIFGKYKEVGASLISGLWSGIKTGMSGIGKFLKSTIVDPMVGWVKALFGVKSPSTVFARIGKDLIAGLLAGMVDKWKSVTKWVSGLKASVLSWLGDTTKTLYSKGSGLIGGLWSGLIDKWKSVTAWIGGLKASVSAWLGNTGSWLVQKGRNVLWGFLDGMKGVWTDVTKWVGGIATWIKDHKGPVSLDGRLLIPAGRAIMSGFLKGLKSGAGPAWDFVTRVGGKTKDALGSILFPQGGITGGLLERVQYQGETLDVATLRALQYAQSILGGGFNVAQGSFEAASSYSGYTHTGGGAIDVNDGGMGWDKAVDSLIKAGFAAWHRTPSQGPWGHHIHALLMRDPSLSPSARGQVADFLRGGDGLAGYKKGTPWVPNDQLAFVHRGEGIIPADENRRLRAAPRRRTAEVVGTLVVIHKTPDGQEIRRELLKLKRQMRAELGIA